MENKILSLLGLCKRAGMLISGEEGSELSIKGGKAYLVVLAEDSSDNTKKKFINMCNYRNVPFYLFGTKEVLGNSIGKNITAVLTISDKNFAESLKKLFLNMNNN